MIGYLYTDHVALTLIATIAIFFTGTSQYSKKTKVITTIVVILLYICGAIFLSETMRILIHS